MAGSANPCPKGYHTITPYLIVKDAKSAIDFYKRALGAIELTRMELNGRVGHAELQIGDSRVMMADECPETDLTAPKTKGGSSSFLHVYVEDVDKVMAKAVAAGATVVHPLEDQFYGDRSGRVADPYGHQWHLASHVEDVEPDEMIRRAKQKFGSA